MNTKCSIYIATSVDGFIAKTDGDIQWLHNPEYGPMGDGGLSYEDFISDIDALVMGRNTFEKVMDFEPWPYEETPVFVLTNRHLDIPRQIEDKVSICSGSPIEITQKLAKDGKRNLYIDGGKTIQSFLQVELIHELTITLIPILLGQGIPLFGAIGTEVQLRLINATTFDNGFVQMRYDVKN